MLVSQMYPETRLRAKHLPLGTITVVTIQRVDYSQITNDKGQPEILYSLYLEEFKLPMKLKMTDAKAMGEELHEDTDYWHGCVIGLQPRMLKIGNDPDEKWTIDVYAKLSAGLVPTIPRNSDPQVQWTQQKGMPPMPVRGALPASGGASPGQLPNASMMARATVIGVQGSVVANEFAKRKKGLIDFWNWLNMDGNNVPVAVLDSICGVPMSLWPTEVLSWIKRYLNMVPVSGGQLLPSDAASLAEEIIPGTKSEVIDTSTGEVLDTSLADLEGPTGAESQVTGFRAQQPQPPAQNKDLPTAQQENQEFANDDIPF